jgi:hypothetical protein
MAKLRVEPFEDIGDPAILLNADRDGMRMFQSAVLLAHDNGEAIFEFDRITHQVVRQVDAADVELGPQKVVWRFDDAALLELLDLIPPLVDLPGPSHQYVDLNSPVEVLVLSVDEYKRPLSYGVFSQLIRCQPLQSRRDRSVELGRQAALGPPQDKASPLSTPTNSTGKKRV